MSTVAPSAETAPPSALEAGNAQHPAALSRLEVPSTPKPVLRERWPSDRLAGWLAPLGVTLLAGVLRFRDLGTPHAFVFDETYYPKDAYSLLQHGHERAYDDNANEQILQGNLEGVFATDPSFVAHPPAGKWVIALGELMFGMDPFGWRFMVALLGTLSVLMVALIGRRLFRSTLLGSIAGLLVALDGLHFVHSRTALLDLILMFFALAAFGCVLLDRDWSRRRLERLRDERGVEAMTRGWSGPTQWLRPWLIAAGVFLGLACSTKWSGIPFVAVFGLFTVAWSYAARKSARTRRPLLGALLKDGPIAFVSMVVVGLVTYVASWAGWILTQDGFGRTKHMFGAEWLDRVPGLTALHNLWRYHQEMWGFNSTLASGHPYASNPWSWPILGRPVSFFYESPETGTGTCTSDTCTQAILGIGTPALWWSGIFAILICAFYWLFNRDWRAGAICAGLLGGYVPWFAFQGRTIYNFYAVAYVPWVALAVTFVLGLLLGSRTASPTRRAVGSIIVGTFVLIVLLNFWWLYPILSAEAIDQSAWSDRMWFRSWI